MALLYYQRQWGVSLCLVHRFCVLFCSPRNCATKKKTPQMKNIHVYSRVFKRLPAFATRPKFLYTDHSGTTGRFRRLSTTPRVIRVY